MLGEMFPGQDPQRHVKTRRIGSNAARFPAYAILRSPGSFHDRGLGRTKRPGMLKAICEWMLSFTRRIHQRDSVRNDHFSGEAITTSKATRQAPLSFLINSPFVVRCYDERGAYNWTAAAVFLTHEFILRCSFPLSPLFTAGCQYQGSQPAMRRIGVETRVPHL